MGDRTGIEWCDATWNPISGCTKVSAGCANCYAERWAKRTFGNRAFSEVRCHPDRLHQPLHWRKPHRIFVASMGDLFHDAVDDGFIDEVFAAMALSSRHIFQVLTKRPKRMAVYCQDWQKRYSGVNYASRVVLVGGAALYPTQAHGMVPDRAWPPQNVWLGVSVEDQETADERIPLLLQTPAAVRFVSIEPMLGPVDLSEWLRVHQVNLGPGRERHWTENNYEISKLDWIIVGGESGPDARPTHPDWVRSVRDQCQAAGVPFFMKQMSKRAPIPEDLAIRQFPDGK